MRSLIAVFSATGRILISPIGRLFLVLFAGALIEFFFAPVGRTVASSKEAIAGVGSWTRGLFHRKSGSDKLADILADSIAEHESGGRFGMNGASGENGAFQFMPATWERISREYAKATSKKLPIDMTEENEDMIARWKIKQLYGRFSGNAYDVALVWNGSLGGTEMPVVKRGTNGRGVKYDTGAYANSVVAIFERRCREKKVAVN